MAKHLVIGARGEDVAAAYLRTIGYHIRDRNVRCGRDEIDLLAYDPEDGVLVFAEVKTRKVRSETFPPSLNLTHRKRICLRRAARRWVADHAYEGGYRIDAVCVADGKVIDHYRELSWN